MIRCRLCGNKESQSLRAPVVFGDKKGEKAFYQCKYCNLIYMSPSLDEKEVSDFYAQEFEKFMEVRSGSDVDWSGPKKHVASNTDNVVRRWDKMKQFCPTNGRVLEVGCSSGFMLDKFRQEGMDVVGIEPSGGFGNHLAKNNYEIYQDIEDIPSSYNNTFDVVCNFFVLEHISDTRKFIKRKLELLRPEGVIFCEVPSATDPLTSLYDIPKFEDFYWSIAHHYYFTPRSIDYLMSDLSIEKYQIIPEQRYNLSNHITWLMEGVPGGQERFNNVFSEELNINYKNDLINSGFFDTFFLVIWK